MQIIIVTGAQGAGTTTVSLLLSKQIAVISNKKTLLIDGNISKPDIFNILNEYKREQTNNNLDIVMDYAISEKNISEIIKTNVEKLNNSNLEILMGSNIKKQYSEDQYINLINSLERLYDIVIIDSDIKVPQILIEYAVKIIICIIQDKKQIAELSYKHNKLIALNKADILINKYVSGVLEKKYLKELLKEEKYKVSYNSSVIRSINQSTLSVESNKFNIEMNTIANSILSEFGYIHKKSFLFKSFIPQKDVN